MAVLRKAWMIYRKDLLVEYRTRERLVTMLVFTLVVTLVFNFAFNTGTASMQKIAPGMLWAALTFAGMLGVNRSFAPEKDRGSFEGMLLAPMDRSAIYLAKFFGNVTLMAMVELVTLPLFALFFNLEILPYLPKLAVILALGTIGFASIGTLFAAIAVNTQMRDVLLPVLLLPLSAPILIASVETTSITFNGGDWSDMASWLKLLGAFTVVFVVASVLLFDYVVEE